VIAIDRGRYTCHLPLLDAPAKAEEPDRQVVAVTARQLGRAAVIMGDLVRLTGDVTGRDGSLARIVEVLPRATLLRRSTDDSAGSEKPLVANAGQLGMVIAVADPEPRSRMIDRCLVAAIDGGLRPLLILTKTDLADPEPLLRPYRPLTPQHIAIGRDPVTGEHRADDLERLRQTLQGQVTVLIGHSGVGKSTLVNALIPGVDRSTGVVNSVTGRGRHTSTSAVALRLPTGGWVIDTPGVRTFGLAHIDPGAFVGHFPDLAEGARDCPRACSHEEEGCALDAYVARGAAGPGAVERLDSLRRLLRSRAGA
jgi:ribosome biogenesis GTPase